MSGRPKTISEVAKLLKDNVPYAIVIGDFLDEVALINSDSPFSAEPISVNREVDARLAAITEILCMKRGYRIPSWVNAPKRFLSELHVPAGIKNPAFIELLKKECPKPFLKRNLLVSENILTRA